MTDDMHRHLTALGSSAVPDPDAAFADHLELQLRDMRAVDATQMPAPRRWPATVAAVAFSVAVVAFGISTIQPGIDSVRISSATGAQLHLPNGSVIEAKPGLEMPEGAWVEVGPSGSASIGELLLGPGQVAEVTPEGVVLAEIVDGDSVPITTPGPIEASRSSDASAPTTGSAEAVNSDPSSGTTVSSTDGAVSDSTSAEEVAPPDPPVTEEAVTTSDARGTTERPTTTIENRPGTTVNDDTTSRPTSSLPPEATTPSSAPSTTVDSSTTLPDENGSTTTAPDESTTTTSVDATIPDPSTTTTTETVEVPTVRLPPDLILGNIIGTLRSQLLPCVHTDVILTEFAEAVLAGLLMPEQARTVLDC